MQNDWFEDSVLPAQIMYLGTQGKKMDLSEKLYAGGHCTLLFR